MKSFVLILCILIHLAYCEDIMTTVAGSGGSSSDSGGSSSSSLFEGDGGNAMFAKLSTPIGVALDTAGNIYIAEYSSNHVRKVTISTGIITSLAGGGSSGFGISTTAGYSGDGGDSTSAELNRPIDVALDSSGNVFIADSLNHRIRKITVSSGIIATFAGDGGTFYYTGDNGAATSASLNSPHGVALDSSDNVYIADTYNNRIRKVTASTGIIDTIAGSSTTASYGGDGGPATSALLGNPQKLTFDSLDNLYFADQYNNRIRKVTFPTGIISTIAGTGDPSMTGDGGLATSAGLNSPYGVAVDVSGNVYISDTNNQRVRKVTASTGIITTFAGDGSTTYYNDGITATSGAVYQPYGLTTDSAGNVYIAEQSGLRIRKIIIDGSNGIRPIAGDISSVVGKDNYFTNMGTPTFIGDNGLATNGTLYLPYGITIDSSDNLYISDYGHCRVRKVSLSTGIITTIAGSGATGTSGDGGDATSALLTPDAIAVDSLGNVYIADANNNRIRKVTIATGIISLVVGKDFGNYFSGDGGDATAATVSSPLGIALDSADNLYIADTNNHRIRKVTASTGIINTFAGSGTLNSYSGDNGDATSALLSFPRGVALDSSGNVYIADTYNLRIRKVTVSTGIITTFAGAVGIGISSVGGIYNGDGGPATNAGLKYPFAVALDSSDNVYIADSSNCRIRVVMAATGIIYTVAGGGSSSSENGAATSAQLSNLYGVAVDSSGNVYTSDTSTRRIRKVGVTIPTAFTPSYTPTRTPTKTTKTSAPSTPHIISLSLFMTLADWPSSDMSQSSEDAIIELTTEITGCNDVTLNYEITQSTTQRRLLTTYSLTLNITLSAMSTSMSTLNTMFVTNMNTNSLVTALNTACGCTLYNSVTIAFISSDYYCIDQNTPTSACSYGNIKINPYVSTIAPYAFANASLTGVDFGGCYSLVEIGKGAFRDQSIQLLDVSSCSKLKTIDENAFRYTPVKVVKLPASIEAIRGGAFGDYVKEVYCEIPVSDDVIGHLVFKAEVLTVACYGYSVDYYTYPYLLVTPYQTTFIITAVIVFMLSHLLLDLTTQRSLSYIAISMLTSIDHGSDWFYFLFNSYMTTNLFWASFAFVFCIPIMNFVLVVIVRQRLLPHFLFEWYIGRIISLNFNWNWLWVWLSTEKGAPLVNHRRQAFTFQRHDSLPKVFIFLISWGLLVMLQAVSLLPFFAWIILLSPYYITLVIIGSFLFHTKLLAHKYVWNCWVTLFTSPRGNRYSKVSIYDTKLLNYSMFVQLVMSSTPLFIIKMINGNIYLHYQPSSTQGGYTHAMIYPYTSYMVYEWYLLSLLISLLFIIIGIYRYVYMVLRNKVKVEDAPFSFELVSAKKQRKSIGILPSQEDITFNMTAVASYRRRWRAKLIKNRVDYSMSSLLTLATAVFFKDETKGMDMDMLLKLRAAYTEGVMIHLGNKRFNDDVESSVTNHELAAQLFKILLRDSVDLTIYHVLKEARIKVSAHLLGINEATREAILASIQTPVLYHTVLSYLNIITCDRSARRNSIITLKVNSIQPDDDMDEYVTDDTVVAKSELVEKVVEEVTEEVTEKVAEEVEGSPGVNTTGEYTTVTNAAIDVEGGVIDKPVVNNPAARKVNNRVVATSSADSSAAIVVNNPSIRKVKNRRVGVAGDDEDTDK